MQEIPIITPEELKEKLEKGEKLNLIDVREEEEVQEGMISEAKHIPMGEIPNSLDQLDKQKEYIFICPPDVAAKMFAITCKSKDTKSAI